MSSIRRLHLSAWFLVLVGIPFVLAYLLVPTNTIIEPPVYEYNAAAMTLTTYRAVNWYEPVPAWTTITIPRGDGSECNVGAIYDYEPTLPDGRPKYASINDVPHELAPCLEEGFRNYREVRRATIFGFLTLRASANSGIIYDHPMGVARPGIDP